MNLERKVKRELTLPVMQRQCPFGALVERLEAVTEGYDLQEWRQIRYDVYTERLTTPSGTQLRLNCRFSTRRLTPKQMAAEGRKICTDGWRHYFQKSRGEAA